MTATHKPARAILALITLAVDLPMPNTLRFYRAGEVGADPTLVIDFATVADGIAWARHLGISDVNPYVNPDSGTRYLGHRGVDLWHGWRLSLNAHEPAAAGSDTPGVDEYAALTALAAAA